MAAMKHVAAAKTRVARREPRTTVTRVGQAPKLVATVERAPRGRAFDLALQMGRDPVRVLRGGDDALAVRVTPSGTATRIEVIALRALSKEEIDDAVDAASRIAGLDDDPRGFATLARAHPVVASLHRRFQGARLSTTPTVWEAYADSIVRQLVTYQEARDALRRMTRKWGAPFAAFETNAFPTGEAIARVAPADLRAIGVGMRRALTLQRGARLADRLERLRDVEVDSAMRWLRQIRGVGVWTANKVAIEAFGHADGVLVGDAGVPSLVVGALSARAMGRGDEVDQEMLRLLEPFRPHRARVVHLLRLAGMRGGVPGVERKLLPKVDRHRLRPWEWW
jgi:3-methyladenine DNA glycosylase/8-oxoguanine DNA glycosylase